MATSGSHSFSLDVIQVIEEAFERAGKRVDKLTPRDQRSARISLNLLFLDWANDQINLWTVSKQSFTTTQGDETETLPSGVSDVLDCYLRRDGSDTPMVRISRDEYAELPNKTDQGRPHHFFIERFSSSVQMTLWQVPENSTDQVHYYAIKQIEEAGDYDRDLDIQRRFTPALSAGLALAVSRKWRALGFDEPSPSHMAALEADYDRAYHRAKSEDRERTTTKFVPMSRRG